MAVTANVDMTALDAEINALITASGTTLPSQTGQAGKFLSTTGSAPLWDTPAGGGLPSLNAKKYLTNDGTVASWNDLPFVYAKDFGVVADGVTDDSAAIAAAQATGAGNVILPPGTIKCNSTINLTATGQTLRGMGRGATSILSASSGPAILFGNNPAYAGIKDMMIYRTGTSTAGMDGIAQAGNANFNLIENIVLQGHYNGLSLGASSPGLVKNVYTQLNYNHGVFISNSASFPGNSYWIIEDVLSQLNDGCGILAEPTSGGMGLGPWNRIQTFGNNSFGIAIQGGSSTNVNAFRLTNSFMGQDGNTELYLDTYSVFPIVISNVSTELCGTYSGTGHAQSIPASNIGAGMLVGSSNADVVVNGFTSRGNSASGILSVSPSLMLTCATSRYNGAAHISGNNHGLYLLGGRTIATASTLSNNNGYGVSFGNDNHIIMGNTISSNTGGQYTGTHTSSIVASNLS